MTNQELERRLAEALSRTAPNDAGGVLSRCEPRKGGVIPMTKKNRNPVMRGLIAACLALVLAGGGGGIVYRQVYAVTSVVSLDVNPSIELRVNRNGKVLVCEALNAEAEAVLADMNGGADLKGTKVDVAVNAVIGALIRRGYLDSVSSAILISVEDGDQARAARLQQELTSGVDVVLQSRASEAAVLSQTVQKDAAVEKQARENHISTGKAALINRVMALNGALTFEALSALSVEELKDLLDTRAPGMPIGREAAAEAARDYAGLAGEAEVRWEVDAELDDVPAAYEVDLYVSGGEFEYVVDAYTGEILRGRADVLAAPEPEKPAVPAASESPAASGAPAAPAVSAVPADSGTGWIGEERALDLALEDFAARYPDLQGGNSFDHRVKLEKDDGLFRYDVKFRQGGYEVDYEIDAESGRVLEWDADYEGPPPELQSADGDGISSGQAETIALAHAGLTEGQVSRLRTERDDEDGRAVYEVDFAADGMEYEYTIDAATGAVLEHEKDRDD